MVRHDRRSSTAARAARWTMWPRRVCGLSSAAMLLLVGFTACERSASSQPAERRAPKPNFVLITIDTLRADHLGCYGYATAQTPNIDHFAASAVQFDLPTTVVNNTLPSHAAMLIGKHPQRFGVPRNSFVVPSEHETLATILKSHGYETAAFISASALRSGLGLKRGFDLYDESFDTVEIDQIQRRASATSKLVVEWLKQRTDQPFFLWVHYFDPHAPYTPPEPYDTLFYPEYEGPADGSIPYVCGVGPVRGFPKIETTPEDRRKLIALYDGEIAFLDAHIGEFLDILSQKRHRERTLVILTGDHGESLIEHNYYFAHGKCVYQPNMFVPLIIRLPGHDPQQGPAHVAEPVQTIDIFATALSQLGIPVPPDTDGRDLTPLCRGTTEWERSLCFGEASLPVLSPNQRHPQQWPNYGKAQFALDYPWKLIITPYERAVELYRLDQDPEELVNLAQAHRDVAERLIREVRFWRAEGKAEVSVMDQKSIMQLRSLGYVESP